MQPAVVLQLVGKQKNESGHFLSLSKIKDMVYAVSVMKGMVYLSKLSMSVFSWLSGRSMALQEQ